jgi:hypothetical protein
MKGRDDRPHRGDAGRGVVVLVAGVLVDELGVVNRLSHYVCSGGVA